MIKTAFAFSLLCVCPAAAPAGGPTGNDDAQAAIAADRVFVQSLEKLAAARVGKLLDAHFEWTDADGKTVTNPAALQNLRTLAAANQGESDAKTYNYGTVEVIVGAHRNARFMRVWVKRPVGWRAFTFMDTVISSGASPFSTPAAESTGDCENPCRTIPYRPTTPADKAILATFQRLKLDEWHPNPDDWAPYVVDDVAYVTSAGALSKADRIARLIQQKQSGAAIVPGDPVISMKLFNFGHAAVMIAQHAPYRGGKPYRSLRVWTLRDGRWQLANSQQTTIAAANPVAAVAARR
jgi:hypothetical protein